MAQSGQSSEFRELTVEEYINGNYITYKPESFDATSLGMEMLNSARQQGTQGIHQLLRHSITTLALNEGIGVYEIINNYDLDEDQLAVIAPKADELLKKIGFNDGVETENLQIYGFSDSFLDTFGLATVVCQSQISDEYLVVDHSTTNHSTILAVYYLDGSSFSPAFYITIPGK